MTIHSPHIRMRGVQAANVEMRPWISGFPVCKALNQYQIIHAGFQEAAHLTRIVRTKQTTTHFLACIGGFSAKFSLTDAGAPAVNPATQSANDADLIQRIMVRSASLVQQKKFAEARLTLQQLDTMKLTPSQQAAANNLKAQIPANQ